MPNPFASLRARYQRWWQLRIHFTDTTFLTQRNIYILPTAPGFMLAATLLVLLVASINYQLNLGYLLTFLLAGCAVVGVHVGHATLRGLNMHLIAPEPQYIGANALISIQLSSIRKTTRHGIGLGLLGSGHWAWTDVPALGSSSVQIAFSPTERGLQRLPTITAETRFPLGTFRVWTYWRPAAQLLVYPRPEAHPPPLPPGQPRAGGSSHSAVQATGEFDGVRAYRRGDPLKLVVWKKAAKADELVSRDSQQAQRHELWLDYTQAGALGLEAKLSRLCAWVLLADQHGLDYGLHLPGLEIPPSAGEAHKRRCLEALALC
ncbi:DUF58 domain-containing protein [Rhodoferax sp. OV413]|uniref:DUF58 domain-containing protein n=1 Tax=Rhodoferax sp. OV413 TaxID=1855285 RepID=UPI000B82AC04|nr:DUF58 domain-containing protein [Rhodoferax sp. OV413]